ncbi:hypothetical protein [Sphingomonas oleivorans]|uniref:hypothetical protein n=1 Tax=Sphingomonas oleivorans TaxID=1735121 RepID=UPI0013FD6547|nr:hypothetical protein [Sphingomonas oleivorans]
MLIKILQISYLVFLTLCAGYALLRGRRPERIGATIMIMGSVLTWAAAAELAYRWHSVDQGIFAVDLGMLVALLALALRSERFWPLWATGFHTVGLVTHSAMMVDPAIVPRAYSLAQGFWAYPALLALAMGTRMSRKLPDRSAGHF